ncbi:hypothetical protein MAP00_009249 [Monascus purpureus]|nr:hypothetical protein MAP00_009249 [Monascus purpureus]
MPVGALVGWDMGMEQAGSRDVWGPDPRSGEYSPVGGGPRPHDFIKCRKCREFGTGRRPHFTRFGPRNIDVPLSTLAVSGRYMWEGWSATRRARQAIHGRGGAADLERQGWLGGRWTLQRRAAAWCCCQGRRTMQVRRGPLSRAAGRPRPRDPRGWRVQGPGVVGVRLPVGGDGGGDGRGRGRRGINADAAGWRPCREAARGKRTLRTLTPAGQLVAAGGPVLVSGRSHRRARRSGVGVGKNSPVGGGQGRPGLSLRVVGGCPGMRAAPSR